MTYRLTYLCKARRTTSDRLSPRSSALAWASAHRSSGMRKVRIGVLGALGIDSRPLCNCLGNLLKSRSGLHIGRHGFAVIIATKAEFLATCVGDCHRVAVKPTRTCDNCVPPAVTGFIMGSPGINGCNTATRVLNVCGEPQLCEPRGQFIKTELIWINWRVHDFPSHPAPLGRCVDTLSRCVDTLSSREAK